MEKILTRIVSQVFQVDGRIRGDNAIGILIDNTGDYDVTLFGNYVLPAGESVSSPSDPRFYSQDDISVVFDPAGSGTKRLNVLKQIRVNENC